MDGRIQHTLFSFCAFRLQSLSANLLDGGLKRFLLTQNLPASGAPGSAQARPLATAGRRLTDLSARLVLDATDLLAATFQAPPARHLLQVSTKPHLRAAWQGLGS